MTDAELLIWMMEKGRVKMEYRGKDLPSHWVYDHDYVRLSLGGSAADLIEGLKRIKRWSDK